MRLRGWYLVLSWLKLFHVVIMYVLVFANVSLKCSVLFRLCLQKRRLCVILPKSGRLKALDKDECVAYHRHGRRKKAGATQQWPPRHYMSWPGRLLTCFFPAYLHLLTYFCLHTLSVTLRSAWERGELYVSCLTLLCWTASHWGRRGRHWSASSIFPCQPVRQCETMLKYKTECLGRDASYKHVHCCTPSLCW